MVRSPPRQSTSVRIAVQTMSAPFSVSARRWRRRLLPRLGGEPVEVVHDRAIAQCQLTTEFLCAIEPSAALIEKAELAALEAQHCDVGRRPHRQVPQLFELDLL